MKGRRLPLGGGARRTAAASESGAAKQVKTPASSTSKTPASSTAEAASARPQRLSSKPIHASHPSDSNVKINRLSRSLPISSKSASHSGSSEPPQRSGGNPKTGKGSSSSSSKLNLAGVPSRIIPSKRMSETSEMSSARTKCYEVLPTLDAVNEDGGHTTVKIMIEGHHYAPVRDTEDLHIHDSSAVGQDGNRFYCQVCKGFGEIVCCDGCPRVYHPDCIPMDDPSRQSLEQDDDPWYCPQCLTAVASGRRGKNNKSKRNAAAPQSDGTVDTGIAGSGHNSSSRRTTSHHRCVDCQNNRSDLALEPCEACGNYVHHPHCEGGTKTKASYGVFCSTCRAVDRLTMEEDDLREADKPRKAQGANLKQPYADEEDDDDDDDMEEEEEEEGDEEMVGPGVAPDPTGVGNDEGGGTPTSSRRKRKRRPPDQSGKKEESANGGSERKHKKKKKSSKKQRKSRDSAPRRSPSPPRTASPQPPPSSETSPYQIRSPDGLAQATPAFFFYLGENRWKIERVLARNHRFFNRLPKGVERNELVTKEAALWWMKLRPADHRRYMNMSMRDFEGRIIEWKEDKNLQEFGVVVVDDEEVPLPVVDVSNDDTTEDDRLTYERHERLYLSTSVGSKPFKPEPDQSYNRVLLDLLHDMRFHPLPMFSVNRSETERVIDDHNAKVTIPYFEVHGPVASSVGDECFGCSRGWLHFCPVLQRRVPAVEHRAKLQPPLSSWLATRIGLGLRPRLERTEDATTEEDAKDSKSNNMFSWRSSDELTELKSLPVLPSSTLSHASERADDITNFIEETMAMKVPEPPRPSPPPVANAGASSSGRKLPTRPKEVDKDPEGTVYKCGRCRTIIYNDTGCVQCRRAQLVINTTKRAPANPERSGNLKLRTVMLGRVQLKEGVAESQTEGDIAVSNAILKERWAPSTILPSHSTDVPGENPSVDMEDVVSDPVDVEEDEIAGAEEEAAAIAEVLEEGEAVHDNDGRVRRKPQRSSGRESGELNRDQVARENKKKSDELYRKTLAIACCGILLALKRRDPLLLFAEPATAEGYSSVVKNPIDLGRIRADVLAEKYSSLGAFVSDVRLLCENALAFNPAGSIYSKTAKELYDLLAVMQKRASDWMGAINDAYTSFLFNEESRKRKAVAESHPDPFTDSEDPFESLRERWPQAVDMLDNGDWLKKQIGADFMRTQENETAYYGSLAVRRVAAAAEASLAPYTDAGGTHSVVSKRTDAQDEALRQVIDEKISAVTQPLQLKDISTWREESVVRLLRKVQSRRLDRRSASENGCSRCDSVQSIRENMKASNVEFAHPGRIKRKGEGDLPRVDPSRMYLTTGLASDATCKKIEKLNEEGKNNDAKTIQEVCVSVRGSKIHGWGMFADQPFKKGETVAEYIGEYVTNPVADARERVYQEQRIQDYQFRLDDKLVLDATMKGGSGRYINHNCNPNCYAKIVPGEDPKTLLRRVLIIAQRAIEINEEISYDYQFPLELNLDNRIPCNCQSEACRGFMNWDIPEKGSNNRALLVQKRGANMRDRIRRLGRPLKRDEV